VSDAATSPELIAKVTHYLHEGFSSRANRRLEIPPALGDARLTSGCTTILWIFRSGSACAPGG
jgi:hypothetical protein